jgi:pilus assembly protein Flp/PilA
MPVAAPGCLRRRLRDQEGQGMTEYALILVLIAVVVIIVVSVIGHQANNLFSNISNGLNP